MTSRKDDSLAPGKCWPAASWAAVPTALAGCCRSAVAKKRNGNWWKNIGIYHELSNTNQDSTGFEQQKSGFCIVEATTVEILHDQANRDKVLTWFHLKYERTKWGRILWSQRLHLTLTIKERGFRKENLGEKTANSADSNQQKQRNLEYTNIDIFPMEFGDWGTPQTGD